MMFDDQTSSNIVWWSNIFKQLMFASPGETVQTCFIKHHQTSEHSCGPQNYPEYHNNFNMAESASQTCLIHLARRTKHHQTKEMFDVVWSNVWWSSKTIKHHQTPSNIIKQVGKRVKCLITKQCLMMFGRQTFPVWPGLQTCNELSLKISSSLNHFKGVK